MSDDQNTDPTTEELELVGVTPNDLDEGMAPGDGDLPFVPRHDADRMDDAGTKPQGFRRYKGPDLDNLRVVPEHSSERPQHIGVDDHPEEPESRFGGGSDFGTGPEKVLPESDADVYSDGGRDYGDIATGDPFGDSNDGLGEPEITSGFTHGVVGGWNGPTKDTQKQKPPGVGF